MHNKNVTVISDIHKALFLVLNLTFIGQNRFWKIVQIKSIKVLKLEEISFASISRISDIRININ